jgi:hypothetical protein
MSVGKFGLGYEIFRIAKLFSMSILTGMAGLKAATDMARAVRDGLKSGQIKGDDIAGRIGEIYDYIVDSKDALVDAKDEVQTLKDQVKTLETELNRRKGMKFADGAYWTKDDGAFCQLCWESENKMIRLSIIERPMVQPPSELVWFTCFFHDNTRIPLPSTLKAYRKELIAQGTLEFD